MIAFTGMERDDGVLAVRVTVILRWWNQTESASIAPA
jgi:hypothetical protein